MPMHAFGHPCDMEALVRVAHDYNLEVIEDAAEALGSFYFWKACWRFLENVGF